MIDIRQLLFELRQVIDGSDFPNAASLAAMLHLDVSRARIVTTKQGNVGINGALLKGDAIPVNIVCGTSPRREIWLLCENSLTPYYDVKGETFGKDQRIIPSKRGEGFGVLFEIDGWTCGFTASSPEGDVDSLFCEEQKSASP